MTYKLQFRRKALKEWDALGSSVRERLKKKLAEVLEHPRIEANRLSGAQDRYKIKLMSPGIRLVYEVKDDELHVIVVAVGKRERGAVYRAAWQR